MKRYSPKIPKTLAARIWAAAPFVGTGVLCQSRIGTTDDGGDSPALGGVT